VAEGDGLENRCGRESTVGSNPTLSARPARVWREGGTLNPGRGHRAPRSIATIALHTKSARDRIMCRVGTMSLSARLPSLNNLRLAGRGVGENPTLSATSGLTMGFS
jgi:hypothetical protein